MSLGFTEIVLIVLVVLLLFGAKRIPEIARALGRASHEFKKAQNGLKDEVEKAVAANDAASEASTAAQKPEDPPAAKDA